jgi:hypothetical protein
LAFVVVHTSNRVTGWISQMVIRGPAVLTNVLGIEQQEAAHPDVRWVGLVEKIM